MTTPTNGSSTAPLAPTVAPPALSPVHLEDVDVDVGEAGVPSTDEPRSHAHHPGAEPRGNREGARGGDVEDDEQAAVAATSLEVALAQLAEMGFADQALNRDVLMACGHDADKAVSLLCGAMDAPPSTPDHAPDPH
jgi:hypothetical protein